MNYVDYDEDDEKYRDAIGKRGIIRRLLNTNAPQYRRWTDEGEGWDQIVLGLEALNAYKRLAFKHKRLRRLRLFQN